MIATTRIVWTTAITVSTVLPVRPKAVLRRRRGIASGPAARTQARIKKSRS